MNHRPEVIFRVDESSQVGFGHMSRCRTLAQALQDAGCRVEFYCRGVRQATRRVLEESGIRVFNLDSERDFLELDLSRKVVVVDGYQFGSEFWEVLSRRAKKTVCIDDYRGVMYHCDALVCYNEGLSASQFAIPLKCQLFLGGRYLLLRPEIRRAAGMAPQCRTRTAVMLVAGGTLQKAWVIQMLRLLALLEPCATIWVLTGQRLSAANVLRASGLPPARVRLLTGLTAPQMVSRYRRARFLVTPASTMMLEAFAAGCPVISGWVAPNQMNSLGFYGRRGMIENVGDLRNVEFARIRNARDRVLRRAGKMIRLQQQYITATRAGVGEIVEEIVNGA